MACPSPGDCEAVGYYYNSSNVELTLAERWNGTKWALQHSPNPKGALDSYLNGVACPSPSVCEAVGQYDNDSTLAERWNGTKWALQTTPHPAGSGLNAVACPSPGDCEAVGTYTSSSDVEVTLAEEWNGTKWAVQDNPNPTGAGGGGSALWAVACPSSSDCGAVGNYNNSTSGLYLTLAERYS